MKATVPRQKITCHHCGEDCSNTRISLEDKYFCCQGCKMVYSILNQHDLCEYYDLNKAPGLTQYEIPNEKFAFLDNSEIEAGLINFRDDRRTHVNLYVPQMHCSSCLYLLEKLHRFDTGIISSKVNFTRKEIDIAFLHNETSLKKVAELLTAIGYEPYISLRDLSDKRPPLNKKLILQLGVAGFCFGNIMMMSFPEYLGIDASDQLLQSSFRWLNFVLAIPVLLYSSLPFYQSSFKSLRHGFLNIDAPIALAIIITFTRSAWELFSGTGAGYFDSMSGIVFFMLAGRALQDKTYRQLSFERDYTSYFPIAVTVLKDGLESPTLLSKIKPGDTLIIHHEELIPADGLLTRGNALIDYSFVTGESIPVPKGIGELVYGGGKQKAGNLEILVLKEVAQSYLTRLWNREELKSNGENRISFVHLLSRYFTYVVLLIAAITALYWGLHNTARIWPAVTSVFIIACPCALLLSNSFTNGNILRILARNQFYLRNAQTIENIAQTTHIVFDKTGTLTSADKFDIQYQGKTLSELQKQMVATLANSSNHPISTALAKHLDQETQEIEICNFKEYPGKGVEGYLEDILVRIGSKAFITGKPGNDTATKAYVSFENELFGQFTFANQYRQSVTTLLKKLKKQFRISIISGDNSAERKNLVEILGHESKILFNQEPLDKLEYIKDLQARGEKVMMIGDGLNDAGALQQSDTGIAISQQSNNFTPSSDAILQASQLTKLRRFIILCRANRKIVMASFILSILYNIIGLFFAVQGTLSPLIAAILMPSSSLSIFLITFGSSNAFARKLKL